MKLSMNGALTIGTLDGANVEIREAVGAQHFFLFGLTAEEVMQAKKDHYSGRQVYETNAALREVLDLISTGFFTPEDRGGAKAFVESLLADDRYLVLADFDSYVKAQDALAKRYLEPTAWWKSAVINVAQMGFFSSDRTIAEYAKDIWGIEPVL
jgi:glycogen phosphorylase